MTPQDPSLQTGSQPAANAQDPLAQLQDIHMPTDIGLWPPAWGWWVLAIVLLISLISIIFFIKRKNARNTYRKLAVNEVHAIQTRFSSEQNSEYLQALSIILRRTALSGLGSGFNVSLKGTEWLEWLDQQCPKTNHQFSNGVGTALLAGPYQKSPDFDRNELYKLSLLWIQEHRNQWQQKPVAKNEAANHV